MSNFLGKQTWKPDLNKNHLRENLRKHIHDAPYLDAGMERIVDQVVGPKVYSMFMPQIEEVVYKFLGIERPKPRERNGSTCLKDLLPKDLDPVSPESVKNDNEKEEDMEIDVTTPEPEPEPEFEVKTEPEVREPERTMDLEKSEELEPMEINKQETLDDCLKPEEKEEEEEDSPTFEPIDIMNLNESNDSHLSGISELTSHRSNSPQDFSADYFRDNIDFNQDSQLSKVSSDSRLSIVTDPGLSNQAPTPVQEGSNSASTPLQEPATIVPEPTPAKKPQENSGKEKKSESSRRDSEDKSRSSSSRSERSRDKHEDRKKEERSKSRDERDSKRDDSKRRDRDKKESSRRRSDHKSDRHKSRDKDKEREKDKEKEPENKKKDNGEKKKDSLEVGREEKKEVKDLKDIYKEKIRELQKKKELTEKEKLNKESSNSLKEKKEDGGKPSERKDRKSSSSRTSSDSKRTPSKDEPSKSKPDSKSSSKDDSRRSEKRQDDKRKSLEKSRSKEDDGKSRSSDRKDRKKKDEKKKDHCSGSSRNANDRRSTDRDGSDGSSAGKSLQRNNSNSNSTSNSIKSVSSLSKDNSNGNSSGETSDSIVESQLKLITGGEVVKESSLPLKKRPFLENEAASTSGDEVKIKKPKFANNLEEARKLMKLRKLLMEQEGARRPVPDEERVQIVEIANEEGTQAYDEKLCNDPMAVILDVQTSTVKPHTEEQNESKLSEEVPSGEKSAESDLVSLETEIFGADSKSDYPREETPRESATPLGSSEIKSSVLEFDPPMEEYKEESSDSRDSEYSLRIDEESVDQTVFEEEPSTSQTPVKVLIKTDDTIPTPSSSSKKREFKKSLSSPDKSQGNSNLPRMRSLSISLERLGSDVVVGTSVNVHDIEGRKSKSPDKKIIIPAKSPVKLTFTRSEFVDSPSKSADTWKCTLGSQEERTSPVKIEESETVVSTVEPEEESPTLEIAQSTKSDEEDCLYLEADDGPFRRHWQFLESLPLEPLEIIELLQDEEVTTSPPVEEKMAPPVEKRKASTSFVEMNVTGSNNNNEKITMEEQEDGASMKKRKVGRPKKQQRPSNLAGNANQPGQQQQQPQPLLNHAIVGESFVMPLSPDSDVSASSEKIPLHPFKDDKG